MSTISSNGTKSPTATATQPTKPGPAAAELHQDPAAQPVRPRLQRSYSAPQLGHPAPASGAGPEGLKAQVPTYSPGLYGHGPQADLKGSNEKGGTPNHDGAAAHAGEQGFAPPPKTGFRNGLKAQLAGFVQSRSAHTSSLARSGQTPLTAEGVAKLQNSTRLNRGAGKKFGAKYGAAMGGFIGIVSAAALGPYGLVMFPFTGIAGTLAGAALGSLLGLGIGHVEPAQVQDLRKHGLYYTGVVGSKKEAANIWRALAHQGILQHDRGEGQRETFRLPHDFTLEAARQALADPVVGLSNKHVEGVLAYLSFAAKAAAAAG